MTDRMDDFDPMDVAAADQLDEAISAGTVDQGVATVLAAIRTDPPQRVLVHVERTVRGADRRIWRPVQAVAGALAAVFLFHGLGNMLNGRWIAEGLGEPYGEHAFLEGGFAIVTLGIVLAAGALRREWAPVTIAAGAPMGLFLGLQGALEAHEFAAGAALHSVEGALGVALIVVWWRARRYAPGRFPEYRA